MKVIEHLKAMSEERFLDIYTTLARDGFGPLDGEVARALRFRPQAVRRLPIEQRARRGRSILERTSNAQLAYELFGSYLMAKCKPLVTGFLDATGVPHQDGMIQDVGKDRPDGPKVAAAVAELDERFDPADVTLYLTMCVEQWPGAQEVETVLAMRA